MLSLNDLILLEEIDKGIPIKNMKSTEYKSNIYRKINKYKKHGIIFKSSEKPVAYRPTTKGAILLVVLRQFKELL